MCGVFDACSIRAAARAGGCGHIRASEQLRGFQRVHPQHHANSLGRLYVRDVRVRTCSARPCRLDANGAGARKGFIRRKKLIDTTIA
jgi:hypothetical protein